MKQGRQMQYVGEEWLGQKKVEDVQKRSERIEVKKMERTVLEKKKRVREEGEVEEAEFFFLFLFLFLSLSLSLLLRAKEFKTLRYTIFITVPMQLIVPALYLYYFRESSVKLNPFPAI